MNTTRTTRIILSVFAMAAIGAPVFTHLANASDNIQWTYGGWGGNCGGTPSGTYNSNITVQDSGSVGMHIVYAAYHSDTANCSTPTSGAGGGATANGKLQYGVHDSGQVTISYNTASYDCGRVQVDAAFRRDNGEHVGILGYLVNYGVDCGTPPPPSISADIKANGSNGPITIPSGTAATLTWTSSGATACTVTPGNFTGVTGSASTGNLTAQQIYTLKCTKNSLSATDKVTVNVSTTTPPPTADIKANGSDGPITIGYNTSAALSWTSTNATACTVTPGNFTGISGTQSTPNLTSSQTYTVSCTGAGGTASDSVTVNIDPVKPTVDIKANGSDGPITIQSNTSAGISWTSNNTNSCTVSPNGWNGLTGTHSTGALTGSQTYIVVCTGINGGTATDSVTVNVDQAQVTADIKANGSDSAITIQSNTSANISWTSNNANSCNISPNGWTGVSGSQQSGNLTYTQTYAVTCNGVNGGTASDSVTVNVQNQQYNLPTVTLNANPSQIYSGNSSVLYWTSNNANTCYASSGGWSGTKSLSGNETVYPSITTTYGITCSNNYGQASAYATVTVLNQNNGNTNIQVTKLVLNRTLNQTFYQSSADAQGLDVLSFEIHVRNTDVNGHSITVQDFLPSELFYTNGSTDINGVSAPDGITGSGLSLGYMNPGDEKIIHFRAVVFSGTTPRTITNTASVTGGVTGSAQANIQIRNRGQVLGAADIVTGPDHPIVWSLLLGFILAFGFHAMGSKFGWYNRFALAGTTAEESEAERRIRELRESEGKPDFAEAPTGRADTW